MKTVSLILARGGSKGVPQKNIKELNGAPLISYVIKASLNSNVDETWVSTDCPEIRDVALYYGAGVAKRPAEFAADDSKNEDTLLHFAEDYKHMFDSDFDYLVSIQPTSPLLLSEDINGGLSLIGEDCDSVFSATKEHWIPRWTSDNKPLNWDVNNRPMRQDMPETYIENGAFWITSKKQLLKSKLRYSGKIKPYPMPLSRSFQIDTLEDFDLIKCIINNETTKMEKAHK
jgi:CMP-N,N'-diacetyllegionaminic acid synthase